MKELPAKYIIVLVLVSIVSSIASYEVLEWWKARKT